MHTTVGDKLVPLIGEQARHYILGVNNGNLRYTVYMVYVIFIL